MSDINYSVWGAPSTWWDIPTQAAWTPVHCPFANCRIGASDWNNADFTDYPTFTYTRSGILRNSVIGGYVSLNHKLDSSLAYAAIANPDLPQCNAYLFDNQAYTVAAPRAVSDRMQPVPFSIGQYYKGSPALDSPSKNGIIYGLDGFPNNAAVFGQQGMQRITPYAEYDAEYSTTWGSYNPNLRVCPFTSFGVKSFILEIRVGYIDYDLYLQTSTLKSYLNHTDEWLQAHQLVRAYAVPYLRTSTSGSYTTSASISEFTEVFSYSGISPVFYNTYNCGGVDIQNIIAGFGDISYFPIYGQPVNNSSAVNIYVASQIYDNPTRTSTGSRSLIYGANRGELHHIATSTWTCGMYMTLDLSDESNVEYIRRGAAAYGLFFCDEIGTLGNAGRDSGNNERWLDDNMYCGIVEPDGCTYGDYTVGEGNASNPVYGWKDSTETPYTPSSGGDTNTYSNKTDWNVISPTASMTKRYVLTGWNVARLMNDLWSITAALSDSQTDFTDFDGKVKDEFLVNNPIDCIISLRRFPFTPSHGSSSELIKLGKSTGTAYGYVSDSSVQYFDFRSVNIAKRFGGSFLDYAPYTEYELYVPFCGTTKLEAADIIGHTLNVRLVVDLTTGSCTAFIAADGLVIQSVSGSIAVEIPVTGTDAATINAQIMNGLMQQYWSQKQVRQTFGAQFTPAGVYKNITSFGISGQQQIASAEQAADKAEYDLTHMQTPVHTIGSASAIEKWAIDLQCRLMIYYPEGDAVTSVIPPSLNESVISKYARTTGFATVSEAQLISFSGLTVAMNPVLQNITTNTYGYAATAEELQLIEQALMEGVILPYPD